MAESVVTMKAKEKMLKARAGVQSLPKIVGMAFGDGGVTAEGIVIPPTEEQTALKNELLRKEIDGYTEVSNTCYRYVCSLQEEELANQKISEVALYDAEGDLVAIKNCLAKGKDDDAVMVFEVDDIF